MQVLSGVAEMGLPAQSGGGVAWWAHIGGFIAGIVLVKLMEPARRARAVPGDFV
jgi:membrane associated rhomboid family serine protease